MFVDPGAFINMFMGVGVLKVRCLFRKLRKLALQYGGVVVFFDEADSLGQAVAGRQPGGMASSPDAVLGDATCNGIALPVRADAKRSCWQQHFADRRAAPSPPRSRAS